MNGTNDRKPVRPPRTAELWPLAVPFGFVVAVFAGEALALELAARHTAVSSDFAMIGLVTFGSGLPATLLGLGSTGVVAVRWPRAAATLGGMAGASVLGALAQQVISGAALVDGFVTASGTASPLFALWVLKWTVPMALVAFQCGRAAGPYLPATSSRRVRTTSPGEG